MTTYIAFLRGINVGGNTILPMSELRSICEKLGYQNVRTYIQSGNVLFESELSEEELMTSLEQALWQAKQKHIHVVIRTITELEKVAADNPFPQAEPARVGVMFFSRPVEGNFLSDVSTTTGEEVKTGEREAYIYYPNGMGRSKLKMPKQAAEGTVRNLNTIRKLVEISKE
jgi:uncharacterized protein (DUF1697 family)